VCGEQTPQLTSGQCPTKGLLLHNLIERANSALTHLTTGPKKMPLSIALVSYSQEKTSGSNEREAASKEMSFSLSKT